MRLLKIFLGAMILPLLGLSGLGLFLPGQWYVERALTLDAPPATVVAFVSDLSKWGEFSPWAAKDQGASVSFAGPTTGAGASMTFAGGARDGTLTFSSVNPAKGVWYQVTGGSWGRDCTGFVEVQAIAGRTRVSWAAGGKLRTYLGRYLQPLLQTNVGGEIEDGLIALKARLQPAGVAPPAPLPVPVSDDVEQPVAAPAPVVAPLPSPAPTPAVAPSVEPSPPPPSVEPAAPPSVEPAQPEAAPTPTPEAAPAEEVTPQ